MTCSNTGMVLQCYFQMLPPCFICLLSLSGLFSVFYSPESVSNAILKVDKSLVVNPEQVPTVKVDVSLLKHITQHLLLCLLLVLGIATERRSLSNLCHEQTGLS